jgi:hypothetical protein
MIKFTTKYGNHTALTSLTGKRITILHLFKLVIFTILYNRYNKPDITKDHIQITHTHVYVE